MDSTPARIFALYCWGAWLSRRDTPLTERLSQAPCNPSIENPLDLLIGELQGMTRPNDLPTFIH
jgi:hypothetical protein